MLTWIRRRATHHADAPSHPHTRPYTAGTHSERSYTMPAVATMRPERVRGLVSGTAVLCALAAGLAVWSTAALAAGESCPNAASRQGPSAALPECRVYEQVTPVDKGASLDLMQSSAPSEAPFTFFPFYADRGFAAEDGEAFLLSSQASLGPVAPTGESSYVFRRGADGWNMTTVAPATPQSQTVVTELVEPKNLSAIAFRDQLGSYADLLAGDPSLVQVARVVGPVGGPTSTVSSLVGNSILEDSEEKFVGGTEDLSEVLVESEEHNLIPGGVAEGQDRGTTALYEWAGGQLRLVNVNDEGKLLSQCGASLGEGGVYNRHGTAYSAVSSDGSKIFFTDPDPEPEREGGPGCWEKEASEEGKLPEENPPELYMRQREADGSTRTVELSVPEPEMVGVDPDGLRAALFVGAAADGSKVFFVTRSELTKDDTGNHGIELYEYNTEPGPGEKTLTRISGGESGAAGNVMFVGAVSRDGSSVYFAAFGALAPGASAYPAEPPIFEEESSKVNLYRYDTLTGRTTFIAVVNANDYPSSDDRTETWNQSPGPVNNPAIGHEAMALLNTSQWYTTANGRYLVFASTKPLTGFDNKVKSGAESCLNLANPGTRPSSCVELYRYDVEAAEKGEQSLVCVSCYGGAPIDDAMFSRGIHPGPAVGPARPISENGSVVFFDTANALVPQATPGRTHVYEWHDGAISMISSPNDPGNAFFLDSSPDGKNVFFATQAQLAPLDTDEAYDVYDARVDGGFAGVVPSQCTGTGCQGVPAAPPIFATPASVTFEGVGNFPPPEPAAKPASKPVSKAKRCKAGFVKKRGRCVRVAKRKMSGKSAKGRK
jgi:hypothetical protein